jgi:hypothetical protein
MVRTEIVNATDHIHAGLQGFGVTKQGAGPTHQHIKPLPKSGIEPFNESGVDPTLTLLVWIK